VIQARPTPKSMRGATTYKKKEKEQWGGGRLGAEGNSKRPKFWGGANPLRNKDCPNRKEKKRWPPMETRVCLTTLPRKGVGDSKINSRKGSRCAHLNVPSKKKKTQKPFEGQ